jgi:hypothetical protein
MHKSREGFLPAFLAYKSSHREQRHIEQIVSRKDREDRDAGRVPSPAFPTIYQSQMNVD